MTYLHRIRNFFHFYWLRRDIRLCQNKKTINRLKKKFAHNEKIKVLFLVTETSRWKCQSLFDLMKESNIFEPRIGLFIQDFAANLPRDEQNRILDKTGDFFVSLGMPVVYAWDKKTGKSKNLQNLGCDIIFYQMPYNIAHEHSPAYVNKFALTCYVPYFLPDYENPILECRSFHKNLFRYYLLNENHVHDFTRMMLDLHGVNPKNMVAVGHPTIDSILSCKMFYETDSYVVYAPHWSLSCIGDKQSGECTSTFLEIGEKILDYAKRHQEIKWAFKPHPTLAYALTCNGKTKEWVEHYYKEWESFAICCYDGSYLNLFAESKALITDCCSFQMEYFYCNKPLIFLHSPFNKNKQRFPLSLASTSFYTIKDLDNFEKTFDEVLIKGLDTNKKLRQKLHNELSPKTSAAKKIFNDLLNVIN